MENLAAASRSALDLAAEQGACGSAQDRTGRALTSGIDRAAYQGAGCTAYDQPDRAVGPLAPIAPTIIAPVTDAIVGRVVSNRLGVVMPSTVVIGHRRGCGDHQASGGNDESNLFHGVFLSLG
jgi:hypothetical protein